MEALYAVNRLLLSGEAAGSPAFDHVCCGRAFFTFLLDVQRKSGAVDTLRVLCAEQLLSRELRAGDPVSLAGSIRAYHRVEMDGTRLNVFAFARELSFAAGEPENCVELVGVLHRPPAYRQTPLGREICDLFVAVERGFYRRDCLPVIVWGAAAREASAWREGDVVSVQGRLQSRKYRKAEADGRSNERTAYEVSAAHAARLAARPYAGAAEVEHEAK